LLWKSYFLVLVLKMLQLISTILLSYVRCRNIRMLKVISLSLSCFLFLWEKKLRIGCCLWLRIVFIHGLSVRMLLLVDTTLLLRLYLCVAILWSLVSLIMNMLLKLGKEWNLW
jgi:hypothetical protein